ncbi:MAG: ABC transporter ATP-binding protein [Flavobacteriales bacterium]|nr:ABC transporter ATP-binding protein [Flavobacteriales bacterium]
MSLFTVRQLSIGYDTTLVADIDLDLHAGEVMAMVGRNGQGKTTLFKTLAGIHPALSGEMLLEGKSVHDWSVNERARKLALVFTERHVLGGFDVRAYVALGRHPYRRNWHALSEEDQQAIDRAIELTGLRHLTTRTMDRLSDGERQRASLARALAQETSTIFLDEPTAFLDYPGKLEVMQILRSLATDLNKLVVFSTHEINLIPEVVDGVIYVNEGKCITDRSTGDALSDSLTTWFGKVKEIS